MNCSNLRPKVGVAVFVCLQGKVLLHQRKGTLGNGTWGPPGGHLEYGETIEECAKRELLEESGLVALEICSGPWTNDVMDHGHYITFAAIVTNFTGTPINLEPEKAFDWHWFDWHSLPQPLFPTVQSFVTRYGADTIFTQHIDNQQIMY